jgi:hypothetical protein
VGKKCVQVRSSLSLYLLNRFRNVSANRNRQAAIGKKSELTYNRLAMKSRNAREREKTEYQKDCGRAMRKAKEEAVDKSGTRFIILNKLRMI